LSGSKHAVRKTEAGTDAAGLHKRFKLLLLRFHRVILTATSSQFGLSGRSSKWRSVGSNPGDSLLRDAAIAHQIHNPAPKFRGITEPGDCQVEELGRPEARDCGG